MTDPLAPTDADLPPAGDAADPATTPTTMAGHGMARGGAIADPLERAVAKAKAAAALFGEQQAVQVGRYRLIERAGAGGMGVVWSAWDPELNRGVALKLASAGDEAARALARDEGRALARLSHPNVVPIYDVFEAPEGVFLVMELVTGKTLRTVAQGGASTKELVRAYRQCGDGLAAAHRAGLIHRDFKPDNAILGADGRVRVLDFGLAHELSADEGAAPVIAGTPRYMAPEQRAGAVLTPAVDQYALAVSLREAVAARGAVPRWLEPILTRAAAAEAAARFPSMDALVAALALDPATRWRRRAAIGGAVVAVGAIAAAFTIGRAGTGPAPCRGGDAAIAAAWGGARRTAANTQLATLTGAYAREAAPALGAHLDRYATDWVSIHRTSCQAHVRRELSTAAYDRRTACLSQRRAALGAIGELTRSATDDALAGLVKAASALPELATCEDDAALASPVAPPSAAQAPEVAAIAELIARVDIERTAGDDAAATANAEVALARARAVGYPPIVARALVARGRIALELGGADRGDAQFTEATRLALEVGDEPLAIEAYARNLFARSTTRRVDAATTIDGLEVVLAITTRLGNRAAFPRALLHHNVGSAHLARGDRAAARDAFLRARAEAEPLTADAALEMTMVLESLMISADTDEERSRFGRELAAKRRTGLGPNHPLTLEAELIRTGLMADAQLGRREMRAPCVAMATLHPNRRDAIGECGYELTWRAAVAGDWGAVEESAALVTSLDDQRVDPSSLPRARGFWRTARGETALALAAFAQAGTVAPDAPWWRQLVTIDVALGRALVARRRDQARPATDYLDEAERVARAIVPHAPLIAQHRLDAVAALR